MNTHKHIPLLFRLTLILFLIFSINPLSEAKNPIVANKGLCDPHIHIFNGKAYCYATHDKSIQSRSFIMEDWWIWSSDNLVDWKHEATIKPEQTYLKKGFKSCWAVDVAEKNGKYYFYFSEGNQQLGVLVGDSPTGPWHDPLHKPLLSKDMTPTHEYDMTVYVAQDGTPYLIFGCWDYYIVRLNDDMISLAETPRKITIHNEQGPYGAKTDDKPNLHFRNGKYYLSWGAYYATADNIYGPYDYQDVLVDESSFKDGCIAPTWPKGFQQGRHGNFFEWKNQWYFTYCDISQSGNRFFRDSFISYIHYNEDGTMARIRVDKTGVGEYNSNRQGIEAEDYFSCEGFEKVSLDGRNFAIRPVASKAYATYPKTHRLDGRKHLVLTAAVKEKATLTLRKGGPEGEIIARYKLEPTTGRNDQYLLPVKFEEADEDLCLSIASPKDIVIDRFQFL